MKIDGENFDFTKRAQEIAQNEIVENSNAKQEKLFNIFDKNKDAKLSQSELEETINIFDSWNTGDETKPKDDELTDEEIQAGIKKLEESNPDFKKENFSLNEVKEFVVKFLKVNKEKTTEPTETVSETPAAEPTDGATEAPTNNEVKPSENPKDYVVPEGQSFKQLLNKILEKQGKTNPTEEDYKKAEEQFKADNPDIEIRERKGVKYLLVGSRVKVPVDFGEELCNPEEEIEKWKIRVGLSKAKQESSPKVKTIKGDNKYSVTIASDGTKTYYNPNGDEIDDIEFQKHCPKIYANANRKTVKDSKGYFVTIEYDGQKRYFNPNKEEIKPEDFKKECPDTYKNVNRDKTIKGNNGYYVYIDADGNKQYFNPKRQKISPAEFQKHCPNIYKNVNKK